MSEQLFITATGTEIGKSYYVQKICANYKKENKKFFAIKPVISGFDVNDENNDSSLILKSLNLENNLENLDKISPWRFEEALSPNIAAKLENKEIDLDKVINFCQQEINKAKEKNTNLLIEGAGGVMTPINDKFTYLDLIKKLQIPAILVTANYLGTISHTLTAIKILENEGIKIAKIILNCKEKEIDYRQNLENLKNFTDVKIEILDSVNRT